MEEEEGPVEDSPEDYGKVKVERTVHKSQENTQTLKIQSTRISERL